MAQTKVFQQTLKLMKEECERKNINDLLDDTSDSQLKSEAGLKKKKKKAKKAKEAEEHNPEVSDSESFNGEKKK